MRQNQCVIVIPVYRSPSADELISLRRCCEVLASYEMVLVCPESMDSSVYSDLWASYNLPLRIHRFTDAFFAGIAGYNRLLLSECFYLAFADYEYILIYQPDAYVFEDRLSEWCDRGFDFVGAPLVGDYRDTDYSPAMPLVVGNGGLCLRNVAFALRFFSGKKNVFSPSQIAERIRLFEKPHTRFLLWLLMCCGWHNKPRSVAANWRYNEDNFWSIVLVGSSYAPNLPSPEEALGFAFERFPAQMYSRLGHLPFGCHAWKKYQYEEFWKDCIL